MGKTDEVLLQAELTGTTYTLQRKQPTTVSRNSKITANFSGSTS